MTAFKPGLLGAYRPPDGPLEIRPDYVPPLGFQEETYVPGHPSKGANSTGWAHFYTCIANGKRVYVWAWTNRGNDSCCVMLSDNEYDPQRGAEIAELQNMFVREHAYNKAQKKLRTHRMPCDPFLVQAFIHQLTLGGNNE